MKFGRLEDDALSKVDWTLPADTSTTQALLHQLPLSKQVPQIYIGCSVWTDRSFLGKIYPQGTSAKHFLSVYCQQFNTVELNATFYSIPSVAQVKKWKAATTPGFQFCPKIPQSISHRNHVGEQRQRLDRFIDAILHFEETLGMTFWQLPPYFQPSSLPVLQHLLTHIPQGFPLAIELRHPAWFSDVVAQQEMWAYLHERGMAAVITDVAGRRDVLHQTLTTDCAFIRFTGNNLHPTDYTRMSAWVDRLQQWLVQGLKKVYFLLHEPEKACCADLAVYLIQQLNQRAGTQLALPQLQPQQATLL